MFGKVKTFLEQVQGELKKVTWSSKEELRGSVVVVIVSTVFLALFIGMVDYIFSTLVSTLIR